MISIKTQEEVYKMEEGGKIAAFVLQEVGKAIRPGLTTLELDTIADSLITQSGAEAAFKRVKGYHFATCINVNDGLVHGLPNSTVINSGDLVKVDLGVYYKGYNTDLSYTYEVKTSKETSFLDAGRASLKAAIAAAKPGNRIGDISAAMQKEIEQKGYSVSRELVGHGIGKSLHESPYVPCYGLPGTGPKIKAGMVLAIEVIYQKGGYDIAYSKDGWTLLTKDGSLAGLFEHTVAVLETGPKILTQF